MSDWQKLPLAKITCVDSSGAWGEEPRGDGGDVSVLRTSDIDAGGNIKDTELPRRFIPRNKERYVLLEGDIVVVKSSGSHTNVVTGKPCYVRKEHEGIAFTNFLLRLRPDRKVIEPEFLYLYLWSPEVLHRVRRMVATATYPNLRVAEYREFPVPVPPLPEQRQILSRLKECLSRVGEMQRLREEVLTDGASLKIVSVRHAMEELRHKYPLVTIGQLLRDTSNAMRSGPFGSAMKHDEFVAEGNLVIGIANVQENRFDPIRKWMITDAKYEQMKRFEVAPGDLLVTIMGTIGRTCVVPDNIGKAITSKHVYRIRLPKEKVLPRFLSYIMNFDPHARRQLFGTAIGGVMPGLNGTKLRNLSITLPPVKVQKETLAKLDNVHAAIAETHTLNQDDELPKLRESILRAAFAGNL